jgi:hypothetical protein
MRCGKAKFAADIRVLDGQRFLEVLPLPLTLTNSVSREELTVGEPYPNVLHSVSSITYASEIMFIWSSITSPRAATSQTKVTRQLAAWRNLDSV